MGVHLERAEILLQQSRYELAEKELREELATDPENSLAHAWLSLCLIEFRQYEAAVKEADLAIHVAPDYSYAHYVQASVALRLYREYRRTLNDVKQLQKSELAIAEAIRLEPENADYFCFLAILHIQRAERWEKSLETMTVSDLFTGKRPYRDCYLKALETVERGLRINPQHPESLNIRTAILSELGRKQQARANVKSALLNDPENPSALSSLGWFVLDEERNEAALQHFMAALRIDPQLENAKLGVVEVYKRRYLTYRWLSITTKIGRIVAYFFLTIVIGELIFAIFPINSIFPRWLPVISFGYCLLSIVFPLVFTLVLQFNSSEKLATPSTELIKASFVCGIIFAFTCYCTSGTIGAEVLSNMEARKLTVLSALALSVPLIPVAVTIAYPPGREKVWMVSYAAVVVILSLVGMTLFIARNYMPPAVGMILTVVSFLCLGISGSAAFVSYLFATIILTSPLR
ncbi:MULTISPECIES: tetratricopeptide repeat protein [Kamptonema]|uniref:tetratricopeptide repeat protein n=1 Tax=Kamptonema TaxID=1501433 RepID=UPI0001DACE9D|nr:MULTISPECIES: tetratricopeptide repeat protein [Kamptonema]CBN54008.1 membrane hypothetical protein [Kamptonema sp. PCC 6506]